MKRDPSLSGPPDDNETPTLRDLFAAAALMGICANTNREWSDRGMARDAYDLADAMLAKRDKSEP